MSYIQPLCVIAPDKMDIDKLRQEFKELIKPKTIGDCSKLLDRYADYLFTIITSSEEAKSNSII